jgi:hypothetical protein
MKSNEHYDVICAGGCFSTYLSAALLCKAGKKVLLVDDERPLELSQSTRYFDPDFVVFSGLSETAALGKSLLELDLSLEDFEPMSAIIQVLTPSDRTVFWNDSKKSFLEFKRIKKEQLEGLKDYFSLFYEAGKKIPSFVEDVRTPAQSSSQELSDWRKYWSGYYKGIHRQHPVPLRKFLSKNVAALCESYSAAIIGSASYSVPNNLCFEQSARSLSLLFQGQSSLKGGMKELKSKLEKIIRKYGGKVKKGAGIESLVTDSKRISGVLLSSYEGILEAEHIVLGTRIKKLYSTLPQSLQNPAIMRSLRKAVPMAWRFTFSIIVNAEVLPLGITSRMVYLKTLQGELQQYPLFEENFISIQISPHENLQYAVIAATVFVPYKASTFNYRYLRRLGGKTLRTLAELIPFLENNIVSITPDFRVSEQEIKKFYPPDPVDWAPENLLQYYISGYKTVQDFWGPSWTTSHPNLYFAGRSIWPSLGVYGEALNARKISQDILRPERM